MQRPRSRKARVNSKDAQFLRDIILYEDDDLYVFNKPHGLASQGGSGTKRHMDGLLKSLPNKKGEAPRLVHRLDRDTSGCLVVAKTKAAATHFGTVFSSRQARKIYWAVVWGNPSPRQGEHLLLPRQAGDHRRRADGGGEAGHARRAALDELLLDHRHRSSPLRLGHPEAGDRPHPPAARAHGAARQPDHGRSALLQHRELAGARRDLARVSTSMPAASPCRCAMARSSTSPRRFRPTCRRPSTCSASMPTSSMPRIGIRKRADQFGASWGKKIPQRLFPHCDPLRA